MRAMRKAEPGQVLVIVAFGMFALVGMAALAIDGGNVYSDRRHAQNAADTSVLAAGLQWVRDPTDWNAAAAAGLSRANDNGYNDNGTANVVQVYQCNHPAATCNLPSPLPPLPGGSPDLTAYYIQTTITSHVPTYLARVLGVSQITNSVQAVVHAVPPWLESRYDGAALVSLMPGCKSDSWPNDPFTLSGSSKSIVNGSGVFVNSDCDNAFTGSNNTSLVTPDGGTCVVGGVISNGVVNPPADDHCASSIDLQRFKVPPVDLTSCPNPGTITDTGGNNYVATAGYYDTSFPDVSPAGNLVLGPGIYCMKSGINAGAGWNITTDVDGNGTFDGSDGHDEGVLLYVPMGEVTFNGGSDIHIGAMNNINVDIGIRGYLIYLPQSNNSPVKIAGSNGSQFIGTILAPASLITLEGGSETDSLNLQCQIMGFSIRVTGNGTLNITYNGGKVGQAWTNPILELYR